VTLFRKSDDKNEIDNDGDDGRSLNKWNGTYNVRKMYFHLFSIFVGIFNCFEGG
jgi:hypothetical protein